MQKIVINDCYGGFGLSPLAISRMAELNGRKAYFFKNNHLNENKYMPITLDEAEKERLFFQAFDIPNPNEVLNEDNNWHEMTAEQRKASSDLYNEHSLSKFDGDVKRDDPKLIQVVEELGKEASGDCADLKIIEIPDGVVWQIEEYDGMEHIAEAHRTWG